jgi:putative transposase
MDDSKPDRARNGWARLRFSVIGPLLSCPPPRGQLRQELLRLSKKSWRHPTTGEPVRFRFSTLERWYYTALHERRDPVQALGQKVRKDAGTQRSFPLSLRQALRHQYREHPNWSVQLHADNLATLVAEDAALGPMPSYSTVLRYMKARGLFKHKRAGSTPGAKRAARRLEQWEVRSYEAEYTHGLWHLDYHVGSRPVPTSQGTWETPKLLGVLDDHSRLACHVQWYREEEAETLAHGLSQAFQKRALPRALMTDNGGAMTAAETRQGLFDLGILHETTLPHSAYQNGKQEAFWGVVEGRLLAMLEGVTDLTLELLNEATQAWVEREYNRSVHSEIGCAPLDRYRNDPDVGRPSPSSQQLRQAFRAQEVRTQRRSDGTISLQGRRFEVPNRFRHLLRLTIRYARWDLRSVDLVDPRTQTILCPLYPLDKTRNASGLRRSLDPISSDPTPSTVLSSSGLAPLLRRLMREYAALGLPPAYLPQEPDRSSDPKESDE